VLAGIMARVQAKRHPEGAAADLGRIERGWERAASFSHRIMNNIVPKLNEYLEKCHQTSADPFSGCA
jgi:hypothetical protein